MERHWRNLRSLTHRWIATSAQAHKREAVAWAGFIRCRLFARIFAVWIGDISLSSWSLASNSVSLSRPHIATSIRLKLAFFDSSPVVAPFTPALPRGLPMVVIAAAAGVGKAISARTVPRSYPAQRRAVFGVSATGVGRTDVSIACIGGAVRPLADFIDDIYELGVIEAAIGRRVILSLWAQQRCKTTLLNASGRRLLAFFPMSGSACIEDEPNFRSKRVTRAAGWRAARPTWRRHVREMLRMRPDRIIVGRSGGGERSICSRRGNTGHSGFTTTIHADSAKAALLRLGESARGGGA